MFNKILEAEIEWCEKNDGAMPAEYRKGFVDGLKQAVYLINAAKKRMVWQDGVMVDDGDLLVRAAQLRIGADDAGQNVDAQAIYHECGNCGVPRFAHGVILEACPNCGDDETDLSLIDEVP